MKATPTGWPRISSGVVYEDPAKAIDWLCRAFGFEVRLKVQGDDGAIHHCELVYGDGVVMLGSGTREAPHRKSPRQLGGANTQAMMVYVDDVEAHCARARGRRHHRRAAGDARLRGGVLDRPHVRGDRPRGPPLVVHAAPAGSEGEMTPAAA